MSLFKFLVMFTQVNPFFAVFFGYDTIGALGPAFEAEYGFNAEDIGLLYFGYSIFTPVMVFFTGILIDKIGANPTAMGTVTLMLLGSVIVAFGVNAENDMMYIMWIGRVFLSFGESLLIVEMAAMCQTFSGSWLNFSFAMSNVWGQIGNAIVFLFYPLLVSDYGVTISGTLFIYAGVMVFVWSTCVLYILLSKFVPNFKERLDAPKHGMDSKMKLADIKSLSPSYWCLSIINCTSTCSIFVSFSFGPLLIVETTDYSETGAGLIICLVNLTVLLAIPTGWVLDSIGHRIKVWTTCNAIMAISFVIMALQWFNPIYPYAVIGICFAALNSSVNASISLVVPPKLLGTAYGLAGVLFCSSLLIFPVTVGSLRTHTGSFTYSLLVLALINVFGTCVNLCLKYFDAQNDYHLEKPLHLLPSTLVEEAEKEEEQEREKRNESGNGNKNERENEDSSSSFLHATPKGAGSQYDWTDTPKISPKTNPVRRLSFDSERMPLKKSGDTNGTRYT